ncbi:MAG TPA: RING-HC finger protein [Candidatus Dependentiae bacterium]|nr:RING-HC finger protein [Candidatus Dependentiae bacterium]
MKSLLKKVFSYVSLLLVTSSLYIHGAVEPIKRLHLIPISYNQQKHEYSILLRKPAQHGEFIDFIVPTHSLLDVDNVAEYMNYFSEQTFGVYLANITPSTRSTRAFTYEGRPVQEDSQDGFIFIEVPFIRGQQLFEEGVKNAPGTNFAWAPASKIMALREGIPYGIYADDRYPINTQYLRLLKLMLPQLQTPTRQEVVATKHLHIIPVSYNQENHEFSVFLVQPGAQGEYRAFQVIVPSLTAPIDPAIYMRQISEQTHGSYRADLRPSTRSNQVFNAEGQPVKQDTAEGYMYIEIPYIRGLDIWRTAKTSLGRDPQINYNWIPRPAILKAVEGQAAAGIHGSIESSLLKTLKATLPLLKRQGEEFILKQYKATEDEAAEAADFECPVCFESKTLKELPCGHKVCAECLVLIERSAQPLCPICRAPIAK